MKSARPKVLHSLAGRPIVEHVLRAADPLHATSTTMVVGHGAAEVQQALAAHANLQFVVQSPQLGTGHALLQTESLLSKQHGVVLVLYADVPLLTTHTLERLLETHREKRAAATVLTARLADPYGYGRIVRDSGGRMVRIVEERDASAAERAIQEINSGIYVLALAPLFKALHAIATDNAQGEYYLTDVIAAFRQQQLPVETLCLESADELRGINSREDLADLSKILRAQKNDALMRGGVTLDDPSTTYIDDTVTIGADTTIGPGVRLEGRTSVGERCRIHAYVRLTNATIEDDVTILDHTIITESSVASGASVGPFAHVRPKSVIGPRAQIGNFAELKKTVVGAGSKSHHVSYLGDTSIGENVNIGAGTITCNYDGVAKHATVIEDDVFIGSDSQLVAPVKIGKGAYVGAGSTITNDVPPDALAISRARQENKPDWAAKRRELRDAGSKGGGPEGPPHENKN